MSRATPPCRGEEGGTRAAPRSGPLPRGEVQELRRGRAVRRTRAAGAASATICPAARAVGPAVPLRAAPAEAWALGAGDDLRCRLLEALVEGVRPLGGEAAGGNLLVQPGTSGYGDRLDQGRLVDAALGGDSREALAALALGAHLIGGHPQQVGDRLHHRAPLSAA